MYDGARGDLGNVYVRYKEIGSEVATEFSSRLSRTMIRDRKPQHEPRFFLAACAAEFAELLRQSEHVGDGNLKQLEQVMIEVANALPLDAQVQELLELTQKAQGLPVYGN